MQDEDNGPGRTTTKQRQTSAVVGVDRRIGMHSVCSHVCNAHLVHCSSCHALPPCCGNLALRRRVDISTTSFILAP